MTWFIKASKIIVLTITPFVGFYGARVTADPMSPSETLFKTVYSQAERLAAKDFEPAEAPLPETIANLDYTAYKGIRFDPNKAIWKDQSLYEIQLFHPGFLFNQPVNVQLVTEDGTIQRIPFSKENFIYEREAQPLSSADLRGAEYSGFRLHFPLNSDRYKDEVLAFQGASYFRLLSAGQTFGLSARGIAVNTGAKENEEFPYFKSFWLLKPRDVDPQIHVFALLDSPSLTGAYAFTLSPGMPSEIRVKAVIFPRKDFSKIGVAPLTSMFLSGENSVNKYDDYRPEIHDSDGLLLKTSVDEWVWRPLHNPNQLSIVSFGADNPKGFGLMQRDQEFISYQDLGANYHSRPSYWIEPIGDWGAGRVELIEIPTRSETNDNIVAFWVPAEAIKPGQPRQFEYLLRSVDGKFGATDKARVFRTGNGWTELPGSETSKSKARRRFTIDFSGDNINSLQASLPIKASVSTNDGKIDNVAALKLPENSGWRITFDIDLSDVDVADMRANLILRGQSISEVWNYVWSPKNL